MVEHAQQALEMPAANATRRRILAAARASFFAQGFRSVTMDQLADELGMSKKTLYAHFPSKTALLEALLQEKFSAVEADLDRVVKESSADFLRGDPSAARMRRSGTPKRFSRRSVRDMQREGAELFKVIEGRRREVIRRYFGKVLEDGRREGLLRKDVPVQVVIEILLAAVQAIMNPARMAELGLTPMTGYSAIVSVILQGAMRSNGGPR